MKTKLVLTLFFSMLFTGYSQAQKKVTLNSVKAGDLYERAHADGELKKTLEGATHLVVTGIMDARDFALFKGRHAETSNILPLYKTLEEVDLSGVNKIEEYNGSLGPAVNAVNFYPADELPSQSFYGINYGDESTYFSKLKKIILPLNIKSIGTAAFFSCEALTSINIPPSVKYISGISTFANTGLTSLNLSENIEIKTFFEDGNYNHSLLGFIGGTKISSFHVPANVLEIGSSGDVEPFPTTIESITFAIDSKLESFSDLYNANSLVKLAFPEGVKNITNIGSLDNLKTLEFPSTLENALSINKLPKLESIISHAVFPPNLKGTWDETFADGVDKSRVTLYVPAAAIANYKSERGWKDFTNIKVIGSDSESQTISNFSDIAAVLGEEITLSAKASSNLPVTYSIADATVASLSGNVVKVLKEGETTITAKQAGDGINFQAVEKTIKLTVLNLAWLEAPIIISSGSVAKVVGPKDLIVKFTKFFVNDAESTIKDGSVDLSDKTGELNLKATTADGSEIIKLKINKQ